MDWAIFESSLWQIFIQKQPLEKFLLLFIQTPGHGHSYRLIDKIAVQNVPFISLLGKPILT